MSDNQVLFSNKPQINISCPSTGRMWIVCGCAFLCILQSAISDGGRSLAIAVTALITAVLIELLLMRRHDGISKIKDGSAAATALILTLMLPNQIHPAYAALGAAFAIVVVKYSFGGLGSNWLNPALGGWLFVRFSWPASFPGTLEASSLSLLIDRLSGGVSNPDYVYYSGAYYTAGEGAGFSGGFMDFLTSPYPGIIADRGSLLLLAGTVIIMVSRVNRFWIPLVYLAVFGVLARFAGALPYGGDVWNGDALFAICSGGTLAAAIFLASDPATGAKSNGGILLAAVAGGVLAFLFRFYGGEPYGAFFAAVFVNAMLPLVRNFERHKLYERYS